ncbi:DUF4062 domain-containing protein [Acrocarpospora macrocephala]|uniref:DUF4062 domain-containing protein n=1 Tax=Acrocarpospora macrocephala TaxID=150177 RepID=UPI001478CF3A|nr:DUF4062 domain-containing protein [Acrocarpospora macrocephala]
MTIFIASPSDLDSERETIRSAVDKINIAVGANHDLRLRVTTSENAVRDYGRPQSLINPLVRECDLFIGLLSRRWGTPTGEYDSGFEEEFETAISRRRNEDRPQILIWFKQPSAEELSDPGERLKKVLEFKSKLEKEHITYIQTFREIAEFSDQLQLSLFRAVLKELQHDQIHSPEGSMSSGHAIAEAPSEQPVDEAREQIASTLEAYLSLVTGKAGEHRYDSDRLLLFSLAASKDDEPIPPHTANRLYSRRQDISLSVAEHRLWTRGFLSDLWVGRTDSTRRVLPFWYFLSPYEGWTLEDLSDYVYQFLNDSDLSVACGALEFMRRIVIRPKALWGDVTTDAAIDHQDIAIQVPGSVVERWQEMLNGGGRQEAAISYLASMAMSRDVPLLNILIAKVIDPTIVVDVRAIRDNICGDPSGLIGLAVKSFGVPLEWQRTLILHGVPTANPSNLEALLHGRHKDDGLRLLAFEQLSKMGKLSADGLAALLWAEDVELQHRALQYALRDETPDYRSAAGKAFAQKSPSDKQKQRDLVLLALISTASELESMAFGPTKSIDAWEALCLQANESNLELARKVFDADGDEFTDVLKGVANIDSDVLDYIAAKVRKASLIYLTRVKSSSRTEGDGDRARKEFHRNHWLTLEAARFALAVLGAGQDVTALTVAQERDYVRDPRVCRALIDLAGTSVAKKLIQGNNARDAEIAATWLANSPAASEPDFLDLLYSAHGNVRMIALRALAARSSYEELINLMASYRQRAEGYFYNVVVELDRLLYAPGGKHPLHPKLSIDLPII